MARDDQGDWWTSGPNPRSVSPVAQLALRVVSVLNKRQARRQFAARPYIANILERRVTSRINFDAEDVLNELRCFQLADETIIDSYIPAVARTLGERWSNNEMGFAEVTIASARLQTLLTEVAYCEAVGAALPVDPPRLMVVTLPGDQHTLGGFVLAAQLRRVGAIVQVTCSQETSVTINKVVDGDYNAVLFTCSRVRALESIAQIVKDVRTCAECAPYFVVGGIVLDLCEDVIQKTTADLATNDVSAVLALCEQRSGNFPDVARR